MAEKKETKPPVPRVCASWFKNDQLELVPCKTKLISGMCPKRNQHVVKHKTNWCKQGWCEGSNPKTKSGNPAPTCKLWKTCPCSCHSMYDKMYSASGQPRELVNNSDWKVDKSLFGMPTAEERIAMHALSEAPRPNAPVLVESPLPDAVPATIRRTFAPTATGRAARGELESWVKDQCDIWLVEDDGTPCTPVMLAAEIGRTQGIREPSVGAISAVFDRWVKIGFAVVEKKPTRFVKYTEEGIRLTLDGCKEKTKREKRLQQGAQSRRIGGREK